MRVLRHGDVNEASVRSVLGNRPVAVEVAPTGDEVSVHVVFTERAQRGGGLSYQSWTSRACVLFTGGAGSDTIRAVDEPCPAALLGDQEATNEVLDVTR